MKNKMISICLSILLIALVSLGAVAAAEDSLAVADGEMEDMQTIDSDTMENQDYLPDDFSLNNGNLSNLSDSEDISKEYGLDYPLTQDKVNVLGDSYGENQGSGPIASNVGSSLSFTDLQTFIDSAENNSVIDLNNDYSYNDSIDVGMAYFGVVLNKSITINGNGHIIDGNNLATAFSVILDVDAPVDPSDESPFIFKSEIEVHLNNLTIQNGNNDWSGAGLNVNENCSVYLKDIKFFNNVAQCGSAIGLYRSYAELEDVCFIENHALADNLYEPLGNGTVYIIQSNVSIESSNFTNNDGGELKYNVYKDESSTLNMTDNCFDNIKGYMELNQSYSVGDDIVLPGIIDTGIYDIALDLPYLLNGEVRRVSSSNGKFSMELGKLKVGNYALFITSFADEDFNLFKIDPVMGYFKVNRLVPTVQVIGDEIDYGQFADVTLNVTANSIPVEEGIVILTVEDIVKVINLSESNNTAFDLDEYGVGSFDIEAIYLSNDIYEEASGTGTIMVNQANIIINADLNDEDYAYRETISGTISLEGLRDGDSLAANLTVYSGDDEIYVIDIVLGEDESFVLPPLDVGKYTYAISTDGNKNYKAARFESEEFDISKADGVIVLEDDEEGGLYQLSYGDIFNIFACYEIDGEFAEGKLKFTFKDEEGNPILNDEGEELVYLYDSQINTFDEESEPCYIYESQEWLPGLYYVTVESVDGNIDAEAASHNITYEKALAYIELSADDVIYGDDVIINISAFDDEGLEIELAAVNVTIGNETKEHLVSNGTVNLGVFDVGSITVRVSIDDDAYDFISEDLEVNISRSSKAYVNIDVEGIIFYNSDYIDINVTDLDDNLMDGQIFVKIDGKVYAWLIDLDEGKASIPLISFVPGIHIIQVNYLHPNYIDCSYEAFFYIEKSSVNLSLSSKNIKEGEKAEIFIELSDEGIPLSGYVIVTVNKVSYSAEIQYGDATLYIDGLSAGEYSVQAYFPGDDWYDFKYARTDFNVSEYGNLSVEIAGDVKSIVISLTDSLGNPVNASLNISIDNETDSIDVVDGKAIINNLSAGDKNITVTYPGDDTHAPLNVTKTVTVRDSDRSETIIELTLDTESIVYGDGNVTATVKLTADGNPIDGTIEVLINGKATNVVVVNGTAIISFNDLAAGNYTVVSNYAGNDKYSPSTDSKSFNVERKATIFKYANMTTTAFNYKVDGRIGPYFEFTLLDADGNPLANKNVSIGLNGATYTRMTNETGGARVQVNLMIATLYTFAIAFLGDENYTGTFDVALVTVIPQTPKLTTSAKSYKASSKTKTLTATLKTANGKALQGKKLTFALNGKSYSAKTNAKGVASVKVSISKKGTYSFTVKNTKDNTYAAVSKIGKLTIK